MKEGVKHKRLFHLWLPLFYEYTFAIHVTYITLCFYFHEMMLQQFRLCCYASQAIFISSR